MLISGPHSLLPPQDPNITGQQRQLRNRRMWELVLHGMAGMYMCIHIYTYTYMYVIYVYVCIQKYVCHICMYTERWTRQI